MSGAVAGVTILLVSPSTRRFTDAAPSSTTVIERGTHFRGDVSSSDPVDIRGILEGDCRTSAHCIVRAGARVLGNIDASAILVAGEVEAGVLQAEKVEVRASARVLATIRARVVAIADGAFFQGEVEILGASPASDPPPLKDRRTGEGEDPSAA
jgi:cytoskeletal protein CcmA (bactofilin family)